MGPNPRTPVGSLKKDEVIESEWDQKILYYVFKPGTEIQFGLIDGRKNYSLRMFLLHNEFLPLLQDKLRIVPNSK